MSLKHYEIEELRKELKAMVEFMGLQGFNIEFEFRPERARYAVW